MAEVIGECCCDCFCTTCLMTLADYSLTRHQRIVDEPQNVEIKPVAVQPLNTQKPITTPQETPKGDALSQSEHQELAPNRPE